MLLVVLGFAMGLVLWGWFYSCTSHPFLFLSSRLAFRIITLEDVLESLLQEQIYDENDKMERKAQQIARWAFHKWKAYVGRRRRERAQGDHALLDYSMGAVVEKAMQQAESNERTHLLEGNYISPSKSTDSKTGGFSPMEGLLGLLGHKNN